MDRNHIVDTYIDLLEQELGWLVELNSTLAKEHETLTQSNYKELEHLSDAKNKLSELLEASTQKRMDILTTHTGSQNIAEFLKSQGSTDKNQAIEKINNRLAEQLKLCQEQNLVNGQIISNNLYMRQEILSLLGNNQSQPTITYASNGSVDNKNSGFTQHQEA